MGALWKGWHGHKVMVSFYVVLFPYLCIEMTNLGLFCVIFQESHVFKDISSFKMLKCYELGTKV